MAADTATVMITTIGHLQHPRHHLRHQRVMVTAAAANDMTVVDYEIAYAATTAAFKGPDGFQKKYQALSAQFQAIVAERDAEFQVLYTERRATNPTESVAASLLAVETAIEPTDALLAVELNDLTATLLAINAAITTITSEPSQP